MWRKLERDEITREYLTNNRFSKIFETFGVKVEGKELAIKYRDFIGKQG